MQVPTKLAIKRTGDTMTVAVDPAREPVELTIDPSLTMGVSYTMRVWPEGAAKKDSGKGLSGGLDFNLGERIFHTSQDGLPVAGTAYIVEIDLAVFETDMPPGHMWSPESPRYKVRWRRTLSQRVE